MGHHHDHAGTGTGHHHDHAEMDWGVMAPMLEQEAELRTPMYAEAMAWVAGGRRPGVVLDAGSGPGVVACLLAETFPQAEVIAVDGEEALLERARKRAARAGHGARVRTLRAELPGGLADVGRVDLIWVGRSLHHVGDQVAGLSEFADHLVPGGTVALVEGGLPSRWFPRDIGIGRPGLQSRIDAVEDGWFAEMRAALPGSRDEIENWPALLKAAGLRPTGSRTFLLDLPAPLSESARAHVITTFTRRREKLADDLDATDLATLDRLLDPEDDASLFRRDDVFLLGAQTVYTATRDA